jgi:branched-chain amino acid transport system substrate-binding protein
MLRFGVVFKLLEVPVKRSILVLCLGYSLVAGLPGCGKRDEAAGGPAVIRIGQVSPLTGPQAHIGKDNDNAARLAVDEINAAGLTLGGKQVRIELLSEDDQADPKTATTVAQLLVDKGVVGVIGHLNSGATIPAAKVYMDSGIPQISPSATAIKYTAQGFKTAFRVMTNDEQQGKVLGNYAVTRLGAKRIAIIDDRTAYGQGLADEVEKAAKAAGGEIVAREYTNDKATDFMAILTSLKAKDPDLVFFGGMDPQGGPMSKQMRQLGLTAQFLGGDGIQTPQFIKLAGADAEGVLATTPGMPIGQMPKGPEFKSKFNAKYGEIQLYAPYAYDAVYVLVEAMKRADSADPRKYLPEIAKTDYQGVTSHIRFDAKGDVAGGAVTLYRLTSGAWVPVETIQSGN